jgi:hypothetical protein
MTQGDKHPEKFAKGQRLTAAALNSLAQSVARIIDRMQGTQVIQPKPLQAILVSDLLAAVDSLTDPSTAQARILARKANGDLEISTREETVVNRFENISIDADTYIKIEWIDGEWQPYAADCGPQSESFSFGSASASAGSASDGGPSASAGTGGP